MKFIACWWRGHGTKLLGTASIIIPGFLGIEDLIPETHVKYWLAAAVVVGALTVKRGFTNTKAQP